jgi:outer membrane protein OmpA-like peptidoglycan-associated protein
MGRAVINPKSYTSLDEMVAMMKENTKVVIQLEGHTDNIGNAEKNMELSKDRVEAVKKYLTSKGVSKDRVKTKAFGGTQPVSTEGTELAKALNRRVEMRVLKD